MSRRAPSDNREVDPRVDEWMRRAIALARDTRPHPNPRVGAVVLTPEGEEIAAGAHLGPGQSHAEVIALDAAGNRARGATLVSTLEPCSHFGRTPPCADAIIASGVSKVIVGAADPDERVSGRGVAKLRAAGVEVIEGVLEAEAESIDPGYFHHRRTGRPRFVIKLAATLDGQTAAADGTSQWITSPQAREDGHALRAAADAVLVGAGTLRADNPRLDVRLPEFVGPQPRPIVVAGSEELPADRVLYERDPIIYAVREMPEHGDVVVAPQQDGVVDLQLMAKDLAGRGLLEILVEGGPTLASSLVAANLADRFVFYFGAAIGGGAGRPMFEGAFATLEDLMRVEIREVTKLGPDLRIDAVRRSAA